MVKLNCPLLLLHLFLLLLSSVSPALTSKPTAKQNHHTTTNNHTNMDQSELDTLLRIISHLTSDQPQLTTNPCKPGAPWPGIECKLISGGDGNNTKFHVTKLNFGTGHPNPPCKKTSSFPSDIFTLPYLQSVSFHQCFTHNPTTITFSPPSSTTNNNYSLQHLSLRSNPSLIGPIPPQLISSLKSLTILTLSQNHLTGEIPSQLLSTTLTRLDLSYNLLTGPIPSTISNLKSLVVLDLSYNSLTGLIPPTILSSLPLLEKLDLSSNNLTGSIPEKTQTLSLVFLALTNNRLTGKLLFLQKLTNLQYLMMDGNPLATTIPDELGELSKLQEIRLGSTSLHGVIPLSLSRLTNLTTLSLENNNLTGVIPVGLSGLTRMYYLNLSRNELEGVVPFDGGFLKRMERNLDLSGNPGLCIDPREVGGSSGGGVGVCGKGRLQQQSVMQPRQNSCGRDNGGGHFFLMVMFRLLLLLNVEWLFYGVYRT